MNPYVASLPQRGLSLIFALLALAALSIASVALIRSIDTSTLVLGNLGYKQETTALAEQGTQEAIRWLNQQAAAGDGSSLHNTIQDVTLYSATADGTAPAPQSQLPLVSAADLADVDPDRPGRGQCVINISDSPTSVAPCAPGNELLVFGLGPDQQNEVLLGNVRYSITRLCRNTGALAGNDCVRPAGQADGEALSRNSMAYADGGVRFAGKVEGILYRIVVRAQGTRDTTTYTETIVQR